MQSAKYRRLSPPVTSATSRASASRNQAPAAGDQSLWTSVVAKRARAREPRRPTVRVEPNAPQFEEASFAGEIVMSATPSFRTAAPRSAENPSRGHSGNVDLISTRMSIRTKAIIAAVAVLFTILYATGVTLMIDTDAAATPKGDPTFIYRAD
jgi:hypothetical protein